MDMTRLFDMSRIRWILAGAVAVLALVATVQALVTYRAYDLTVGVLSVIALAVTMLVGLGSLALARRRIGTELAALKTEAGSSPVVEPVSTLLRDRRDRLLAIRAAGVRPDRQVLAEATAAEEAGRAYIGRYFVATTVLIGLVGTFAGLMATLSKVGPILQDKDAGGLALLAGPLSGLHVTFGASLVAILATLALALAQGDLALHEEQALAALEDRTTHQIIPELWPPDEEPAERTVRAFGDLKNLLAEAVAQSLEQSATRMAKTARSDAERAARALETTAAALEKQVAELGATVGTALQATAATVEKHLKSTTAMVEKQLTQIGVTVGSALESSAGTVEKHLTKLNTTVGGALESSGTKVEKQLGKLSAGATSALESSADVVEKQITKLSTSVGGALELATQKQSVAMAEATEKHAAAMAEAAQKHVAAMDETAHRQTAAMAQEAQKQSATMIEVARAQGAALLEAAQGAAGQARGAAEESVRRSAALAEESVRATTAELGRTLQPMLAAESQRLEQLRGAFSETVAGIQQASARVAELQASLEGASRAQVSAIENAGQAVLAAFDKAVLGAGGALEGAAGKLAAAAHDLGAGVETFSPKIATLATELGALGRELALQAARGPEGDLGAVVLSELERIGAGLDRLTQLSRMAGGTAGAFPPPTGGRAGRRPHRRIDGRGRDRGDAFVIRRSRRFHLFPVNVWPPFVDALTLVLAAFVLLILVALVAQRGLLGRLRERDSELTRCARRRVGIERRLRALAPRAALAVDDGKVILQGEVLFDTGSDALRPEGDELMAEMGRNLAGLLAAEPGQMVLVGGHTDDRAIHGGRFRSNWELSRRGPWRWHMCCTGAGVPADRVVASGFGEHHPRADNIDESGRAKNRRIEVLLVPIQAVSSR